jgi:hypothetical protein
VKSRQAGPSYGDARLARIAAALSLRLYGIPIEDAPNVDDYVAIWWCGTRVDLLGYDHRHGTKRIWHLPKDKINDSGPEEGFTYEGHQVFWFDVARDIAPIEETYVLVSMRKYLAPETLRRRPSGGTIPTISPEGPMPTISPEGPMPTISPEGPMPTILP